MNVLVPWKRRKTDDVPAPLWDTDWLTALWPNPVEGMLSPLPGDFPARVPAVDISEDKDAVTVRAEVPGIDERDIDVSWERGTLRIRGEKRDERKGKEGRRRFSECRYGSFSRHVPVGEDVDWQRARARYKRGVLTVTLPKKENARKGRRIKVQ